MELPNKFILKEDECILSAIGIDGIPKINKSLSKFKEDHNDLLCVINDFKPCAIIHNFDLTFMDQDSIDRLELIYYARKLNIRTIPLPLSLDVIYDVENNTRVVKPSSLVVWKNDKNTKQALFLYLLETDELTKIESLSQKYLQINLDAYDYINGKLLGYRDNEIRGYFFRNYCNYKLKGKKLTKEEWLKEMKLFNNSKDVIDQFDPIYLEIKNDCDKWLKKINESEFVDLLINKCERLINKLPIPTIIVSLEKEEQFILETERIKTLINNLKIN
jgi:hypothetical protein